MGPTGDSELRLLGEAPLLEGSQLEAGRIPGSPHTLPVGETL